MPQPRLLGRETPAPTTTSGSADGRCTAPSGREFSHRQKLNRSSESSQCRVPEKDVNYRIGARLRRQQLLDRRGVDYLALVGSSALTNHLGSSPVMQEQLRHLLRTSQRSGVTLRLVAAPTSFTACGWYLMDYEKAGSVVLLEHLGSSTFLFDEETAPYAAARKDLRDRALSERSTRDRIEQLIEQHVLGS
ncbi:DUF5753 domain-containing protein [Actinophytocola glycyrrhizae]|uniref:DUF5753 domain-containing protein n=1 Tax=Actinophytocola glycyrrhizae TaxID=2044873 RepID=A0ABV9RY66_9PSEU